MKRNPKQPRQSANLSEAFRQRLTTYALAAGAAGVSLLALAPVAQAAIGFQQENIILKRQSYLELDFTNPLYLGGSPEFFFHNIATRRGYTLLTVWPLNGTAGVEVSAGNRFSALALAKNAKIGSSKTFEGGSCNSFCINMVDQESGNWVNVTDRYLGLRFQLSDGTHYGWARFSVEVKGKKIIATFTGYAYEGVPNKPILAGDTGISSAKTSAQPHALLDAPLSLAPASQQPASLGMLALGAPGIPFWRNEPASATK